MCTSYHDIDRNISSVESALLSRLSKVELDLQNRFESLERKLVPDLESVESLRTRGNQKAEQIVRLQSSADESLTNEFKLSTYCSLEVDPYRRSIFNGIYF